jgi:hypothetical protein
VISRGGSGSLRAEIIGTEICCCESFFCSSESEERKVEVGGETKNAELNKRKEKERTFVRRENALERGFGKRPNTLTGREIKTEEARMDGNGKNILR